MSSSVPFFKMYVSFTINTHYMFILYYLYCMTYFLICSMIKHLYIHITTYTSIAPTSTTREPPRARTILNNYPPPQTKKRKDLNLIKLELIWRYYYDCIASDGVVDSIQSTWLSSYTPKSNR